MSHQVLEQSRQRHPAALAMLPFFRSVFAIRIERLSPLRRNVERNALMGTFRPPCYATLSCTPLRIAYLALFFYRPSPTCIPLCERNPSSPTKVRRRRDRGIVCDENEIEPVRRGKERKLRDRPRLFRSDR